MARRIDTGLGPFQAAFLPLFLFDNDEQYQETTWKKYSMHNMVVHAGAVLTRLSWQRVRFPPRPMWMSTHEYQPVGIGTRPPTQTTTIHRSDDINQHASTTTTQQQYNDRAGLEPSGTIKAME